MNELNEKIFSKQDHDQGLDESLAEAKIKAFLSELPNHVSEWKAQLEQFKQQPLVTADMIADDEGLVDLEQYPELNNLLTERINFIEAFIEVNNTFDQIKMQTKGVDETTQDTLLRARDFFHDFRTVISNIRTGALFALGGEPLMDVLALVDNSIVKGLAFLESFDFRKLEVRIEPMRTTKFLTDIAAIIEENSEIIRAEFSINEDESLRQTEVPINSALMLRVMINIMQNLPKAYIEKAIQDNPKYSYLEEESELSEDTIKKILEGYVEELGQLLDVRVMIHENTLMILFQDYGIGFNRQPLPIEEGELSDVQLQQLEAYKQMQSQIDGVNYLPHYPVQDETSWVGSSGHGEGLIGVSRMFSEIEGADIYFGTTYDDEGKPTGARIEVYADLSSLSDELAEEEDGNAGDFDFESFVEEHFDD